MDKSTIAAIVFAGISAVLLTDRGLRFAKDRKKEEIVNKNLQWSLAFDAAEQIPYQGKWGGETLTVGGEWDSIYLDTALVTGKVYQCFGPNNSKAVIAVTALYGPVAITLCNDVISYAGHPKLALLKLDDKPIFSRPLDPSWLGSVVDPQSEVYGITVNAGWTQMYESIEEIKGLANKARAMDSKLTVLANELADKTKLNSELRTALKLCRESCDTDIVSYKDIDGLPQGTFGYVNVEVPVIETENAIVTWMEVVTLEEKFEEIEIDISDDDILADLQERLVEED